MEWSHSTKKWYVNNVESSALEWILVVFAMIALKKIRGINNMLNRVILIGRLTKDPELKYTPSGVAVTNFTLAVERNFKNAQGEKETDFFSCSVFKQLAELCANYMTKGKLASIDGRIQIRTYNDKDGQKHWVTEIIGESVQFLSPKVENEEPSNTNKFGKEVNIGSDDIPF